MNTAKKYVVSKTIRPGEQHTAVRGRSVNAVHDLKTTGGPNSAVLGSGSIAVQLGEVRLVDEYQFVIIQLRAQSPLVFSA
jgi:hypothetical protein